MIISGTTEKFTEKRVARAELLCCSLNLIVFLTWPSPSPSLFCKVPLLRSDWERVCDAAVLFRLWPDTKHNIPRRRLTCWAIEHVFYQECCVIIMGSGLQPDFGVSILVITVPFRTPRRGLAYRENRRNESGASNRVLMEPVNGSLYLLIFYFLLVSIAR